MRRTKVVLFVGCCALFVGTVSGPARANLIFNGSFEQASVTYTTSPYDTLKPFNYKTFAGTRWDNLASGLTDWMRLKQNQTAKNSSSRKFNDDDYLDYRALQGWTVYGQVDWKSGDANGAGCGYWRAEDGNMSIDLNGQAGGGIAQAIATTAGDEYTVSFWMSGNPYKDGNTATSGARVMEVAVGNGAVKKMSFNASETTFTGSAVTYETFTFYPNDPNEDGNTDDAIAQRANYEIESPITDMKWKYVEFEFTAESDTTTLLFQSLLSSGHAGVVMDSISVVESHGVPEPAIFALLAAGIPLLLVRRKVRG